MMTALPFVELCMQRYSVVVLILGALATIGPLSIDAYLPAFPAIGRSFAADPALVQQTLSAYLFAYALTSLLHGTLSDSFGRRPVILASLGLYTAGSLCAALAPSVGILVIGRTIQGLSAGAGMIVGQAIVRDSFDGPLGQRTMSYITMIFGVSPALAPILGGWIAVHLGWRAVFYAMSGIAVVLMLVCLRFQRETLSLARRQPFRLRVIARNYVSVVRNWQFMLLSVSFGFAFGGFAFFIGTAPNFIIDILHLPETAFAWLFVPLVVGMMGGSWVATRLSRTRSPHTVIAIGFGVMGVSCGLNVLYNLLQTPALPWAVVPVMIFTFGLALAAPSMTMRILDLVPELSGMGASVLSFVQMILFSIVTGALVPLTFGSGLKMAIGVSGGLLVSSLGWYGFRLTGIDTNSVHKVRGSAPSSTEQK